MLNEGTSLAVRQVNLIPVCDISFNWFCLAFHRYLIWRTKPGGSRGAGRTVSPSPANHHQDPDAWGGRLPRQHYHRQELLAHHGAFTVVAVGPERRGDGAKPGRSVSLFRCTATVLHRCCGTVNPVTTLLLMLEPAARATILARGFNVGAITSSLCFPLHYLRRRRWENSPSKPRIARVHFKFKWIRKTAQDVIYVWVRLFASVHSVYKSVNLIIVATLGRRAWRIIVIYLKSMV